MFIKAMEEGYWVLIERIESAPEEIGEILSGLCGLNPEFTLNEGTDTFKFNNKNIETSNTGRNQFLLEGTFKVSPTGDSFTFKTILYKSESHTFTFIKNNKIYVIDFKLSHTANSGIWNILSFNAIEIDTTNGTFTTLENASLIASAVRTIY